MKTERISYKIRMDNGTLMFALIDFETYTWQVTTPGRKEVFTITARFCFTHTQAALKAEDYFKSLKTKTYG